MHRTPFSILVISFGLILLSACRTPAPSTASSQANARLDSSLLPEGPLAEPGQAMRSDDDDADVARETSDSDSEERDDTVGALTLTIENDLFARDDNNYTSGLSLQWTTAEVSSYRNGSLYRDIVDAVSFLPFVGDDDRDHFLTFSLTHQIYTPTDIENPNPPTDDQPYAGLLHTNLELVSRGERTQHDYSLLLGVVGPAARGEQAQTFVHEVIRTDEPEAWDTQLDNEPLVNVNYAFHYRLAPGHGRRSLDADLTTSFIGNLGTYLTGGGVGVTGRLGFGMPDSYSSFGIQSGFTPNRIGDSPTEKLGGFLFASISGIGIAHFMPHGNIWSDSRSVDTEPFIGVGSIGFSLHYGDFQFSYGFTKQSDAFETQRKGTKYGALSLTYSF